MLTDGDVERWLREDIGHHDVTNDVPGDATGRLVATEPGVASGIAAAARVFAYLDVDATPAVEAGDRVSAGDVVLTVAGPARGVLRGERVAVNVAAHASGIATRTRRAVATAREAAPDPEAVAVAGTRKTTPGLRGVEKRAVAHGGGDTHRLDLSHMVMVKDNHVAALGVETAVERFRDRASFATQIEVEAETVADARAAVTAGADAVLVDNADPETTADAVAAARAAAPSPDGVVVEASGGIGLDDVGDYAATGVDVVSMGSLTHSAPALDYSFRLDRSTD